MTLQQLLAATLSEMDGAIVELGSLIPRPRAVPFRDGFVFRHVERLPRQAILQKLTRIPAGLRAAQILCDHGYFQEQGALQRMIDELGEDVIFLAVSLMFGGEEQIHRDYLDVFFTEEFEPATGKPLSRQRPMVPRKKIRAYIAHSPIGTDDPSSHVEAGRTISKAYSGFVHAASPHIMETYGGVPPRFHTSGMLGTAREREYREDILKYYNRGLGAFVIGARAIGNEPAYLRLYALSQAYASFGAGGAP